MSKTGTLILVSFLGLLSENSFAYSASDCIKGLRPSVPESPFIEEVLESHPSSDLFTKNSDLMQFLKEASILPREKGPIGTVILEGSKKMNLPSLAYSLWKAFSRAHD